MRLGEFYREGRQTSHKVGNLLCNFIADFFECGSISSIMINVEVKKNKNENAINLIRRFSRKVKGSGTMQAVRAKRFRKRSDSAFKQKQSKLTRLERKEKYERLKKLGKLPQ